MRKLTYFIACSADGFIAREDGSIDDFTFDGPHVDDLLSEFPETIPTHLRQYFDIDDSNKQFDTVLMGRRTYEVGLNAGVTSPYAHLNQFVFSTTISKSPDTSVTLVSSNALDVVRQLKEQDGSGIWLCGGSSLASALFDEIDEIVMKSNPFLMGHGKPMFAQAVPKTELLQIERRNYTNGFALTKYMVKRD